MQLTSVFGIFYLFFVYGDLKVFFKDTLTFNYVTSYNRGGRIMTKNDIQKTSVNVLKPIIFIIAGLTKDDRRVGNWSMDLSIAYADKLVSNVFVVDWEVALPIETSALDKAVSLALELDDFIKTIFDKTKETYLDIHLVGVALGCAVAAATAEDFKATTGNKIQRVTCLEPFYYGIDDVDKLRELKSDKVNFVDVVQTIEGQSKFGQNKLVGIGNVDFYIDKIEICDCKDVEGSQCNVLTSSSLFARSVNTDIPATKCDSLEDYRKGVCENGEKVTFGENVKRDARGKYFLQN